MQVTGVDTTVVSIPFRRPYNSSAGTVAGNNSFIVKVHTAAGISGSGEACGDGLDEDRVAHYAALYARQGGF